MKGNVKIAGLGVTGMGITPAPKEIGEAFTINVTLHNYGTNPIDVWMGVYVFDPNGVQISGWVDAPVSLGNQPANREITIPHNQASGWTGPAGDYTISVTARVYTGAVPETGDILDQVSGVILNVTLLQVLITSIVAS